MNLIDLETLVREEARLVPGFPGYAVTCSAARFGVRRSTVTGVLVGNTWTKEGA